MEMMQKNVVQLAAGCTLEQVDALYLAGMRVALLDGNCSAEELERLCSLVKTTFYNHNDPIGLMLRLTPGTQAASPEGYQYVLLDGFTAETARRWKISSGFSGTVLSKEPASVENWAVDGILTSDPVLAAKARDLGLLVMVSDPAIKADALLWCAGTPVETIAQRQENPVWDAAYLNSQLIDADVRTLTGRMAALNAMKSGAKAILVFTTDGSNLSAVSSLYPPIPVIAVAKRPEKEAMLLQQTMRWNTLPTAITRTPGSMDLEGFARFVAELYGYQKGDTFVAVGHWVEGQNQEQLCCFTL